MLMGQVGNPLDGGNGFGHIGDEGATVLRDDLTVIAINGIFKPDVAHAERFYGVDIKTFFTGVATIGVHRNLATDRNDLFPGRRDTRKIKAAFDQTNQS